MSRAVHVTGREPILSAKARAALCPHLYLELRLSVQVCELSGASMQKSRIRLPAISRVSITDPRPVMVSAWACEGGYRPNQRESVRKRSARGSIAIIQGVRLLLCLPRYSQTSAFQALYSSSGRTAEGHSPIDLSAFALGGMLPFVEAREWLVRA